MSETSENTSAAVQEAARVMGICNSCRYCEGFCAVFPAMERRLVFAHSDIHYLANLCHNCGACLHACQYAPPHEFRINVPRAMARVRQETYAENASPAWLGRLYSTQGTAIVLASIVGLFVSMLAAVVVADDTRQLFQPGGEKGFYAVIPHGLMVTIFGSVFIAALISIVLSCLRFWSRIQSTSSKTALVSGDAVDTLDAVARLRYLDGGGDGCPAHSDRPTHERRRLHHLVFYGFMLCFASTSVATLYHYALGWVAPYPVFSVPVLLGTAGGIAMVIGCLGILRNRSHRDPDLMVPDHRAMDVGFVLLLLSVAATGLILLVLRETHLMPLSLIVHLASVMALFLLLPFGKFVHGIYRGLALLHYAREKRQPNPFASADS